MVLKNVALFIAYNFILFSITLSKTAKKVELWKIDMIFMHYLLIKFLQKYEDIT